MEHYVWEQQLNLLAPTAASIRTRSLSAVLGRLAWRWYAGCSAPVVASQPCYDDAQGDLRTTRATALVVVRTQERR